MGLYRISKNLAFAAIYCQQLFFVDLFFFGQYRQPEKKCLLLGSAASGKGALECTVFVCARHCLDRSWMFFCLCCMSESLQFGTARNVSRNSSTPYNVGTKLCPKTLNLLMTISEVHCCDCRTETSLARQLCVHQYQERVKPPSSRYLVIVSENCNKRSQASNTKSVLC